MAKVNEGVLALIVKSSPALFLSTSEQVAVSCYTKVHDGPVKGRWVSLALQQPVTFVLAPLAGACALQSMQQQRDLLWLSKNLCAAAQVWAAC